MRGCSTYVALDGLDVGLQGAFDPVTFDYFLRVRREDRTRVLRRRVSEGDVGEAPEGTLSGKVTGARFCSALVAFSSGAPTGGDDTSQSRCESRAEGIW